MRCIKINPSEFLFVDGDLALLASSYRDGKYAGVNYTKDRKLTDDEMLLLLDQIGDDTSVDQVEGPLPEDQGIFDCIIVHFPEYRNIVTGVSFRDIEEFFMDTLFLSKEQSEEREKLKKYLNDNKSKVTEIAKQMQREKGLVDFLEVSLDNNLMDVDQLETFNKLLKEDKEWIKKLDLNDVGKSQLKRRPKLVLKLEEFGDDKFLGQHGGIDTELLNEDWNELRTDFALLFTRYNLPFDDFDIEVEGDPEEAGDREVTIQATIGNILHLLQEFKFDPRSLQEDLY